MKKQIVKSLSILCLLVLLSGNAVNVLASGGTCSVPSCRPKQNIAAPETAPSMMPMPAQLPASQAKQPAASPKGSFNFTFFLAQWMMSYLSLL
jgi:hypothetical protein